MSNMKDLCDLALKPLKDFNNEFNDLLFKYGFKTFMISDDDTGAKTDEYEFAITDDEELYICFSGDRMRQRQEDEDDDN